MDMTANSLPPAPIPTLQCSLRAFDEVHSDSLVAFCWSDVRPLRGSVAYLDWRLCGAISYVFEAEHFMGKFGEVVLIPIRGRLGLRRLFVFGLGSIRRVDDSALRRICMQATEVLGHAKSEEATFLAPGGANKVDMEQAFVEAVRATRVEDRQQPIIAAVMVEG
jgi:hypothetical protein